MTDQPAESKRFFKRHGLLLYSGTLFVAAVMAVVRYSLVSKSAWNEVGVMAILNAVVLIMISEQRRPFTMCTSTGCGLAAAFPGHTVTMRRGPIGDGFWEFLIGNCFSLRFLIGAAFGVLVAWTLRRSFGSRDATIP